MESGLTTEELFAGLSPEERAEALRLATRLQAKDNDSATLLAAAREAGIEDRYLRAAAAQTGRKARVAKASHLLRDGSPELGPNFLAIVVLLLFVFVQLFGASFAFSGTIREGYWPIVAFAGILGLAIGRGRPRWFAPAVVLTTWILITTIAIVASTVTGRDLPAAALSDIFRMIAGELPAAFLGAALASALSKERSNAPPRPAAVPE